MALRFGLKARHRDFTDFHDQRSGGKRFGAGGVLSVDKNAQAVARNGCRLARHGLAQALALKSGGQVAVAAGKKA